MVHRKSRMLMLILVLVMIFVLQSTKVAAEENSLFYEGKDFTVELLFTNKANISEDAVLRVTEFYEGSEEYENYYSQTDEFVKMNTENEISYVRFFDISILDGEVETEPDDTVQLLIHYEKGIEKEEESDLSVIHFQDNGNAEFVEICDEDTQENLISEITFEEDSFSVFGMIILDSIDSSVKESGSETITDVVSVDVCKEWSDGNEVHENDSVTISLYDIQYEEWEKCDEIILNDGNNWQGKFDHLDRSKEYGIRETKVISGNEDVKATYQSTITDTSERLWCPKKTNELKDGQRIIFTFYTGQYRLLRKSSTLTNLELRSNVINVEEDSQYGKYCTTQIQTYEIWESYWNSEQQAWEIYHPHSDVYLTLLYDKENDIYQWGTSAEKTEGSYLQYDNGTLSATIGNVTKYMGNITVNGPYEGLDAGDEGITEFQIYTYQIFRPGKYVITNTKNEAVESEIQADVITGKTIDDLGDGQDNPDTDIDDEEAKRDLYRLNLDLEMKTDATGLDLLMVIDVSSSMNTNKDSKDANGNYILRSEALRQALNQFIPEFLPKNTKNRVSIVAFECQSMILTDWTNDKDEVLKEVNREVDGTLPLYDGEGTNYEAALTRAHEALTKRGYSGNAQAMIFLSDGEPTVYIYGNDHLEAGNVTVNLGEAGLVKAGIDGTLPDQIRNVWMSSANEILIKATNESIASFKNHNPEIMVGTIAFNMKITDYLKTLATDAAFVTQIQNGTPNDLIQAMELITEFVPREIVVVDELSEYVELYEEEPDFKIVSLDEEDHQTVLYDAEHGLTVEGEKVLDKEKPLQINGKLIQMNFQKDYMVENGYQYSLSFNVKASQKAYDEYADAAGFYPHKGDEKTDYRDNKTSSEQEGFYSNGEKTRASYSLNGAATDRKYRKPVVQVRDGKFVLKKIDLDGNVISTGAQFELYRKADEGEKESVYLKDLKGEFVKVGTGITDENGELIFEHLRLAVFDEGYPYYLVETTAPDGYVKCEDVMVLNLFSDRVEIAVESEEDHPWYDVESDGKLVVKNAEYVELPEIPVTGGNGKEIFYIIGILFMTGGCLCFRRKCFQK